MSVILRTPLSRAADYANRGRAEQTMTRSLAVFSCPLEWVSMTVFNYEADYSFAIVILRMSFGSILDILALKVVAWWRSVTEQWLLVLCLWRSEDDLRLMNHRYVGLTPYRRSLPWQFDSLYHRSLLTSATSGAPWWCSAQRQFRKDWSHSALVYDEL